MYERTTSNNASVKAAQQASYVEENAKIDTHSSSFLGKVYGYMALALLITFAVGLGMSMVWNYALTSGNEEFLAVSLNIAIVGMIFSAFAIGACCIIITFGSIKSKMNITVPGIIYCIAMGFLISFTLLIANDVSPFALPSAFAITGLVFGILFFIGRVCKNMRPILQLAIGFLTGGLIIGIALAILFPLASRGLLGPAFTVSLLWIYVIFDVVVFLGMFGCCAYDVWRIEQIARNGGYNKNLALYCAFILYQDFIYILLRVLRVLIVMFAKSKK